MVYHQSVPVNVYDNDQLACYIKETSATYAVLNYIYLINSADHLYKWIAAAHMYIYAILFHPKLISWMVRGTHINIVAATLGFCTV